MSDETKPEPLYADPPVGSVHIEEWRWFKANMLRLPQTPDIVEYIHQADDEISKLTAGLPWMRH